MAATYVCSGDPDGSIFGRSGESISFFGGTVTTRPSVTWPNTGTATTTLNETKCNRLMAALVALNLIVTT